MAIDLTSLFADILPNPEKEMQERGLKEANMLTTMGAVGASYAPERAKALRLGAGGMFGLDTRTESEHLQQELKDLGQPETMSEHKAYADLLDEIQAGSGIQYMMKVGENNRAEKDSETRRMAAINKKKADEAANTKANKIRHPVGSEIKANGTTISLSDDGTRTVRDPAGVIVTGIDAATVINASNAFDLEQALGVANAGEEARRTGQKMIDADRTLASLRVQQASLDQALGGIEDGAYTGMWDDMLPTFTNAQAQLRQAQNQLGLAVVGDTTFGSLSAGELNLALNTALPTKMDGPELTQWINERRELNERVMEELHQYIIFTIDGGDAAGWEIMSNNRRLQRKSLLEQQAADTENENTEALLKEMGIGVEDDDDTNDGNTPPPPRRTPHGRPM